MYSTDARMPERNTFHDSTPHNTQTLLNFSYSVRKGILETMELMCKQMYKGVSKSFWTEYITKYMLTFGITH